LPHDWKEIKAHSMRGSRTPRSDVHLLLFLSNVFDLGRLLGPWVNVSLSWSLHCDNDNTLHEPVPRKTKQLLEPPGLWHWGWLHSFSARSLLSNIFTITAITKPRGK